MKLGQIPSSNNAKKKLLYTALTALASGLSIQGYAEVTPQIVATYNTNPSYKTITDARSESTLSSSNAIMSRNIITAGQANIMNHLTLSSLPPFAINAPSTALNHTFLSQGLWVQSIHMNGDDHSEHKIHSNGGTLGWDAKLNNNVKSGFALTYMATTLDSKDIDLSTKGEYYMSSFYVGWVKGPWIANGILSYAKGKNNNLSIITHREQNTHNSNDHNTKSWSFTIDGGYNASINKQWVLQPKVQLNYININLDHDALQSNALFINGNHHTQIMEAGTGIWMIGDIVVGQGHLIPHCRLMGYYDFNNQNYHNNDSINAISLKTNQERARGVAGVGITYATKQKLAFGLAYDYNFEKNYNAHSIMANVSYVF